MRLPVKKTFRLLRARPKLFFKRLLLELKTLRPLPNHPVLKKIRGVRFEFNFALDPFIKRMYQGTYDMAGEEVLKTFLKEGDTFIDVGANIGYITALGAGYVGEKGEVHSFEPVPEYFKELQKVAAMNKRFKIKVNQVALGEREGRVKIYLPDQNIGHNTIIPELITKQKVATKGVIEAPMQRLDKYLREEGVAKISLIKIDVEGFEFPVLLGLEQFFVACCRSNACPPILSEICPRAYPLLGYKLEDLLLYMEKFSYLPLEPLTLRKRLSQREIEREVITSVLFKPAKRKNA